MNKVLKKMIVMISVMMISTLFFAGAAFAADTVSISGTAHVQNLGWINSTGSGSNHLTLGTTGQSLRMEAYTLTTSTPGLGLQYSAHVQDIGWMSPVSTGQASGTEGQSKRVEGFTVTLTGEKAKDYSVYYRTHVQNYGWLDWAKDGQQAGTTGHSYRCEALEIVVQPKSQAAPGTTVTPCIVAVNPSEAEHLLLVNNFRKANGRNYVSSDPNLHAVAEVRVRELPARFSHYRPDGSYFDTAVKTAFPNYRQGAGGIKENITFGGLTMSEPRRSFETLQIYVQNARLQLDEGARYMSWAGHTSGSMGYAVEIFSGLDRIDFAD